VWNTVTHVTSGITLVAFLIAAFVSVIWRRLKHQERALASAPPTERAALIQALSDSFLISARPLETKGLSPEQTFQLLREQLRARTARFKITNIVFVVLTLTAATVTILLMGRTTPSGQSQHATILTKITPPSATHIFDPTIPLGSNLTVAAFPWLRDFGLNLSDIKPSNAEVVIINNRALYYGLAVHPTTSETFLTELGNTGPSSFTLQLPVRARQLSVTRPALVAATGSGVSHPAWSIHAIDAEGRDIATAEEPLLRSMTDVPQRTLTLVAPVGELMAAVRIDSDPRLNGKNFAGFNSVLIERLTFTE
jgi:hypothetical protein